MKSFMLMAFLAFSFGAGAATEDGVHSIVKGKAGEPHLIKFNSGAVKFLEESETSELKKFEAELSSSKLMSRIENKSRTLFLDDSSYEVTAVPDAQIPEIFDRMNPFMRRKSECSDRAHVWTWDEFQKSGIKSEKAFLFLTDTYIKRHRYKWWFHVAPMYTTTSGKKYVLDKQFYDHPTLLSKWIGDLVFTKLECVKDFRFIDYDAGADQSQDCYFKSEPMYYYVPADIRAFELGRQKTNWSMPEVNGARSRAFFKGSN